MYDYSNIPQELKEQNIWGIFVTRKYPKGDKLNKIPLNPTTGKGISTSEPADWTTFERAKTAYENSTANAAGLAMLVHPPYVFLDLDHKEANDPITKEFFKVTDGSYCERSISKHGFHIFVKGHKQNSHTKGSKFGVEVYDSLRFCAVTGDSFNGSNVIKAIPDKPLNNLIDKYLPPTEGNIIPDHKAVQGHTAFTDDDELIKRAANANDRGVFKSLFYKGWKGLYPTQSEADWELAQKLAFWTNKDFDQMDRIFRRSKLMRDKWDSKREQSTYGAKTLNKAIRHAVNTFKKHPNKYQFDFNDNTEKPVGDFNTFIKSKNSRVKTGYYSYDDTGMAERVVDSFHKQFIYIKPEDTFHYWNKKVWKLDNSLVIAQCVNQVVEKLPQEPVHVDSKITDSTNKTDEKKLTEDAITAKRKFITRERNHRGKVSAIEEIKPLVTVEPDKLDADNSLTNTPAGIVKADFTHREIKLIPHDPKYLLTKITNGGSTTEHPYKGSRWEQFLKEIFLGDVELIEFMQRAVGYSLIGLGKERKMFILYGDDTDDSRNGSNGKSVFLDAISNTLGDYSWKMNPDSIIAAEKKFSNGSNATPDIAALKGKRFVTTSEIEDGAKLNEARVKSLTSREPQSARELYKSETNFIATFTIWLSTNYKPQLNGTDAGIWSRLVYVPFLAKFTETSDPKIDIELPAKLDAEQDIIFDWVIDGAEAYLKDGLCIPQQIIDNNEHEKNKQDIAQQFIDDCLEVTDDSNDKVSTPEIRVAYNEWSKTNHQSLSFQRLSKRLKDKLGNNYQRSNGQRLYVGVKLLNKINQQRKVVPIHAS
ncbi:hypothetical protein HC026_11980 [Lactobacillus sp. LC28-10]|uniref:SF3 helicase domain-containing protein n=1 Tax=Secundilactobacillus angelensis TaxID=2722706 RepID=A0ABX1L082_9LACO|nr:phage/plasmid primase, P4 family [Secundilactobacillus angelensis]MCH5463489.1 phage/plasmid primase, P4 family [Secundilactobacillus angelensis]NLR19606.1 hypothetical protein [Secundilactobacillus angelensis]